MGQGPMASGWRPAGGAALGGLQGRGVLVAPPALPQRWPVVALPSGWAAAGLWLHAPPVLPRSVVAVACPRRARAVPGRGRLGLAGRLQSSVNPNSASSMFPRGDAAGEVLPVSGLGWCCVWPGGRPAPACAARAPRRR